MMQPGPNVIDALQPAQRAQARLQRLPRRQLGRVTLTLLVALRLYVLVAIPIVGYAFVHALSAGQ